jgi:prophage regulatory protein
MSMGVNPRSIAMLPQNKEVRAMRIVSKRQLKELVLYSPQHIQRLENAGQFPKRVRLGNGPRGRVGWIEGEVLEWLNTKIAARHIPHDTSQ